MGKRKRTTIGYSYFMGLHMGVCRGPVNRIAQIKIGGRSAYYNALDVPWGGSNVDLTWPPNAGLPFPPAETSNEVISLNEPELFGGTKAEGGIVGKMHFLTGAPGQLVPQELKNMLGNPEEQPEFRGVMTVYFDGMICQMNPYPKPWRFLVRRTDSGWDTPVWYREKCTIYHAKPYDPAKPFDLDQYRRVQGMNAAHIIYEALTNPLWGRGLDASRLDGNAFRAAADTLYDEQMGLCLRWSRSDLLETFIQTVLDHIAGVLYQDKVTGLYTLKLLRNDYDFDALPLYTTDNGILEISEASSGSTSEAINEVVVNYRDPILDMEAQVRVQNIAAIQTTGSFATREVNYLGVPTDALAMRLAQRDLKIASTNLRRFRISGDRRLWKIQPGDVIKISDVARSIGQIALRVGTVDDGTLTGGRIDIVAVQDVFSYQLSPFGGIQPPLGTLPDYRPTAKRVLAYEKPYVELNAEYPPAEFGAIPDAAGIYNYHMERPSGLVLAYDIGAQRGGAGEFVIDGSGDFTPMAAITGTLDYLDTLLVYSEVDNIHMEQVEVGQSAWINGEFVRVDAIDLVEREITIARGVMDTVPKRHTNGTLIWFTGDTGGTNYVNYSASEIVNLRGMPYSMQGGRLPIEEAPEEQVTMNWRMFRAYPPGDVIAQSISTPPAPWFNAVNMRYDADGYFEGETWVNVADLLTLNWTHRDRVLQADQLVEHQQSDIGPEPGTTYRVRILNAQGVQVRVETGIQGTQFTYSYGQAYIDLQVETAPEEPVTGFIELYTVRDGLTSWDGYLIPINVYKIPEPEMQSAQTFQMAMITSTDTGDATGMQSAETTQMVATDSNEQDITGVQSAQSVQSINHKAVYLVAMDNRAYEAPYISLLREGRNPSASQLKVCVARPSDRITDGYDLYSGLMGVGSMGADGCGNPQQVTSDTNGAYSAQGAHPWTPWAVLSDNNMLLSGVEGWVDYLTDELIISVTSVTDGVPIGVPAGTLILVDDEWMEVISMQADRIKVRRGVADTVPARHRARRPIWLCENAHAASNELFGNLNKAKYKLNPHTLAEPAPVSLLPEYSLLMQNRPNRPYPPGFVMVDGTHWFNGASALAPGFSPRPGQPKGRDVLLTWSYRNRLWQADDAYDHFAINVPPEEGVTYVLELWYRPRNATCPIRQRRLVTDGNSLMYTAAMALEDGNVLVRAARSCGATIGQFTLKAVKDGVISWQGYAISIRLPSNVTCPTDGDGGDDDGPIVIDPPPGGGDGEDGSGGNPGNPNPDNPDEPTDPTDPEYPEPEEPDIEDPEFPDTGEPPVEPPEPDPNNATGWGEKWDHGWAGPET